MRSLFLSLLFVCACHKSEDRAQPAPSSSLPATAPPASAPSATASAAAAPQAFTGTYTLTPSTLYIPAAKDWAGVKQGKDDPAKLVGDGTLSLAIDPTGHISGTIDSGPASPALIEGRLVASEIRGVVRRKDPKDDGLTGTLVAQIEAAAATGTLSLSDATGAALRQGKLALKTK